MPGPRQTTLPKRDPSSLEPQLAAPRTSREGRPTRDASATAASSKQPTHGRVPAVPAAADSSAVPRSAAAAAAAAAAVSPQTHSHTHAHSEHHHMHQRSQPHAHARHAFPQPSAPRPAVSPSASPPRRRYQRHHPYTQPANNASGYSPSPPLLTETVSAPSAAAATASSLDAPLSLRAGADMSSSSTRSRHIHTPAQLHQSAATTSSPYSLVAQPPAPDSASYLHGTSHASAAYPEPSPAGAYGQHHQHHHQSSAYRSQAPPYHNGHHHHSYSMTAPSSIPMTTSTAIGHLHPSSMASLAHGDAASAMYLHPGSVPLSASTSPVVPPGARSMTGSGRPLTAEEKEIKRKVSHSAIEKR
ncbi:hypothetical protein IWW45_009341, partial [Coemansia sp. RSA 485]